MERHEHTQIIQNLLTMVANEHQATASELLTQLANDYEVVMNDFEKITTNNQQLIENNEKLRSVNSELFLQVGHKSQPTPPAPDNGKGTQSLKYDDLFNEKGELK